MPHLPSKSDRMDVLADLSKDQLLQIIADAIGSKSSPAQKSVPEPHGESSCMADNLSYSRDIENLENSTSTPVKKCKLSELEGQTQLPFIIPVNKITEQLETIQRIGCILGNSSVKMKSWFSQLDASLHKYVSELQEEKERVNNDFIKSLETITKIFSITSKFSPIESINEAVLTPTIRNLILDYNAGKFKTLDNYATESLSMFELNKDVEENLVRLIPILSQQLLSFNKQLKTFYSLFEIIDDNEVIEQSFLVDIPTKSDMSLFDEINEATDIKTILQTNFSKINPTLVNSLDVKIRLLKEYIGLKVQELKDLMEKVINLNHQLFRENDPSYLKLPLYINDQEQMLLEIGIKSSTFNEYHALLRELKKLKTNREQMLNSYLIKVEQLWSILRPNSNEIQEFLKVNKNLYPESLHNFKTLLAELEIEKIQNIRRFINSSRDKIKSFWNILMYDEDSRLVFGDFYVEDESAFDEALLDSHTRELERLRKETEDLKPLLSMISQLDDLVEDKLQLEEASKDSSRLLKRNSFKILKEEEMTRKRLAKNFPLLINDLKSKIEQFESENKRAFKLNGVPYLCRIEEIEEKFVSKKRNYRSNFNSPTLSSTKRNSRMNKPQIMGNRTRQMTPKIIATPSRSIIRKRDPSDMTNPFLSNSATPLNRQATSPSFTPTVAKPAHILSSSPQQLSTEPIILRGTSPVKSLNLNASTKINMLPLPSTTSPNLSRKNSPSSIYVQKRARLTPNSARPTRSPMSVMSNHFNNRDNIRSKYPKSSIPTPKASISNLMINERNLNHLHSVPVEELSDSMIDYSDTEEMRDELKSDKENKVPILLSALSSLSTISKQPADTPRSSTNKEMRPQPRLNTAHTNFNLSLDSETF